MRNPSASISALLVTGLLVLSNPALAADSFETTLRQTMPLFSLSFFDPRIYRVADCEANVLRLLQKLDSRHIDLSHAKVLYIFGTQARLENLDRASLIWLYPNNPKIGFARLSPRWMFHVILLIGNAVLDLDYGHWPRFVRANDYFNSMFPEQPDLYVRLVPAREYLADYQIGGESQDWRYYLFKSELRYPAQQLVDFLWGRT